MSSARIIHKPAYLTTTTLQHYISTLRQLLAGQQSLAALDPAITALITTLRAQARQSDLPHAQFATLLLLEARLSHHSIVERNAAAAAENETSTLNTTNTLTNVNLNPSTFTLIAPYLQAWSQFISGYLDIARVRTTGSRAGPSMYDLAATIGMPDEFVAFRHAINHLRLPSLPETLRMWTRGLAWLVDGYWAVLAERVSGWEARDARLVADEVEARTGVEACLRAFLRARKSEVKRGGGGGSSAAVGDAVPVLFRGARGLEGTENLIQVLLRSGMLVPGEKDISRAAGVMKSSVLIWDDLLRKLGLMLPQLAYLLLLSMSIILNSGDAEEGMTQRQRVMRAWVSRILESQEWALVRKHHLVGVTIKSLHLPS